MIALEDVSFAYGQKPVLQAVSLRFPKSGAVCLFGASALQVSGKIQRCSFGKVFHSTGAWGLVGQFAQTLFLLLPICGAATGMLYLCGQMKLTF